MKHEARREYEYHELPTQVLKAEAVKEQNAETVQPKRDKKYSAATIELQRPEAERVERAKDKNVGHNK